MLRSAGFTVPRPRPKFGHGSEVALTAPAGGLVGGAPAGGAARRARAGGSAGTAPAGVAGPGGRQVLLLGCYHPSQQNTFTGRVTPAMLDEVFGRARRAAGAGETG